jgi:succinate dehydrogenase / fumarate reductase cytochrome b subunit
MHQASKRPINLDLMTIKFPLAAIVSILHRLSGVLLGFLIPVFLGLLQYSLSSAEHFETLRQYWAFLPLKLVVLALLAALVYHLIAGLRHLLMDMGYGDSLAGGRLGARLVFGLSAVLIIMMGIRLW